MPLHLKQVHISMLGVGVTAVGVVAMILYYRHLQASQAAQDTAPSSGMGSFPYFQTAAVPTGADGSSSSYVPPATADTSTTLDDLANLIQIQTSTQSSANIQATLAQGVLGLGSQILSQQHYAAALAGPTGYPWEPDVAVGYFTSNAGGGYTFGVKAVQSIATGWNPEYQTGANPPPNSTGSTAPPATVIDHAA